jgi:hypothetical protein
MRNLFIVGALMLFVAAPAVAHRRHRKQSCSAATSICASTPAGRTATVATPIWLTT